MTKTRFGPYNFWLNEAPAKWLDARIEASGRSKSEFLEAMIVANWERIEGVTSDAAKADRETTPRAGKRLYAPNEAPEVSQ